MRDPRTSLTEVAKSSGFANQHHMARIPMCHGHDAERLPWVVVIINSQKRGKPSGGL
jgi:hypothetical protein